MAPKGTTGSKRKNPPTTSSGSYPPPPPRNYDETRFSLAETYARFLQQEKRGTWHDKVFTINLKGKWSGILAILVRRKWQTLLNLHTNINLDILREFYANALPEGTDKDKSLSYTTFMRGENHPF